jgi:hypothetical protein
MLYLIIKNAYVSSAPKPDGSDGRRPRRPRKHQEIKNLKNKKNNLKKSD